MPRYEKVRIGVIVPVGALALLISILYVRCWIKRQLRRRRTATDAIAMNDRREGSDKSGPQAIPTEGLVPVPAEVEGSQVGAEVEGSGVGPVEMDANQTHVPPTSPPPYGAPDVAPDNNPLHEPPATPGSWYAPNLGAL